MLILASAIVSMSTVRTAGISGVGEIDAVRVDQAPVAAGEREDQRKDCETHRYETLAFGKDRKISFAMTGPAASHASLLSKPETPPIAFGSPPIRNVHITNAHMGAS